jgi:hypothetical protein
LSAIALATADGEGGSFKNGESEYWLYGRRQKAGFNRDEGDERDSGTAEECLSLAENL